MKRLLALLVMLTTIACTSNTVVAQWSIISPIDNAGDEYLDNSDLQAWGQAPVNAVIRVEVWGNGVKITEQIIGPLPKEFGSGGGGGYWWANFMPPPGGWNTSLWYDQVGIVKLYDHDNNALEDTSYFIFTPY